MADRDNDDERGGAAGSFDREREDRDSDRADKEVDDRKREAVRQAETNKTMRNTLVGAGAFGVGTMVGGPIVGGLAATGATKLMDWVDRLPPSAPRPAGTAPIPRETRNVGGGYVNAAGVPQPSPSSTTQPSIDWRSLLMANMPPPGLMQGDVSQPLPAVNLAPAPMPAPTPVPTINTTLTPEQIQANTILQNRAKTGFTPTSMQPAIDMAAGAANGTAPSAAQEMMKAQSDRLMAQQMGAAYARGGYNPGAVRGAQQAGAMAQQGSLADMATLRANEQQQGRALYGNLLGQQSGYSIQAGGLDMDAMKAYSDVLGVQRGQTMTGVIAEGNLGLGYGNLDATNRQITQTGQIAGSELDIKNKLLQAGINKDVVDAILRSQGLNIQQQQVDKGIGIQQQQVDQAAIDSAARERAAQLGAGATVLSSWLGGSNRGGGY